jgi:hypothetical protein
MSAPGPAADDPYAEDEIPVLEDPEGGRSKDKGPTVAQRLVAMAQEQYRVIRSTDARTYAVPKDGPAIATALGSKKGLRVRLGASLHRQTGIVASGSALSDCMAVLEGEAADLEPQPVYLRMGAADGEILVDLGTEVGHVARITPRGWSIQATSPVVFRRSTLTHPFPPPTRGGSLDALRALINLSEEDFRLAIGWVVAAYFTEIPHAILLIQGEQGTAKTNLTRTLLTLIDPQPAAERDTPGDKREWAIFASASWGFCFDNITEIPDWLSNSLCKGATGDAVLQRELNSDEDIVLFKFRRVIAMNTIGLKHEMANDLADRILMLEPEVIEARLSEEEIAERRAAALPAAFGAVLDLVAGVLKHLPDTVVPNPPRMADFAKVLAALDTVTGWKTLPAYRAKVEHLGMTLIEGDTLARALYYLAGRTPAAPGTPVWEGTAGELLTVLRQIADERGLPLGEIPGDPRVIGRRVREIAPVLRKVGIDVRSHKSGPKRTLRVIKHAPQPEDTPSSSLQKEKD